MASENIIMAMVRDGKADRQVNYPLVLIKKDHKVIDSKDINMIYAGML